MLKFNFINIIGKDGSQVVFYLIYLSTNFVIKNSYCLYCNHL